MSGLDFGSSRNSEPLTRVKHLRVLPFFLIMVQRPQVDHNASSFSHCEIPDAENTQARFPSDIFVAERRLKGVSGDDGD